MSHLLKACREDIQVTKKAIAALEAQLKPLQAELTGLEAIEDQLLKQQLGTTPPRRKGAKPAKAAKPAARAKGGKQGPRPTSRSANKAAQVEKVRAMLAEDPELTGTAVREALGVSEPTAYRYLQLAKDAA